MVGLASKPIMGGHEANMVRKGRAMSQSSKQTFILQCADRTTGETSVQRINASTEKEAVTLASSRGLLVSNVQTVKEKSPKASNTTQTPKPRKRMYAGRGYGGALLSLVGLLPIAAGVYLVREPEAGFIEMVVGASFITSGVVMFVGGGVIAAIDMHRRGVSKMLQLILERLDDADGRD
jgi:hypothetical protein